tara:strand:- start:657 stop:800 length:144 start_codon:yes stop_codon:yes gene_type:complete
MGTQNPSPILLREGFINSWSYLYALSTSINKTTAGMGRGVLLREHPT